MSFIILHNHKAVTMSYSRAKQLEAVMNGTVPGSPRQKAFAKSVKKIYFGKSDEQLEHELSSHIPQSPWWSDK